MNTLLRNAWSTLIVFLFWMFLVALVTLAFTASSPHGGAAFIYCASFLGLFGAAGQVMLYLYVRPPAEKNARYSVRGGAFSGLVSWVVSLMVSEHSLVFPINTMVLMLLVYLCLLGAGAGWASAQVVMPRLTRR